MEKSRKVSGSNFVLVSLSDSQDGARFQRGKKAIPGFTVKGDALHRTTTGKGVPVRIQKDFKTVNFVRAFTRLKAGNQILVNGQIYVVTRPR